MAEDTPTGKAGEQFRGMSVGPAISRVWLTPPVPRLKLLYVTDLYYPAKGRVYRDEDLAVTERLRSRFDIALCQPTQASAFIEAADVIVSRNTGPVIHYAEAYAEFRSSAILAGACVYNPLTGLADMQGKQYLLDLFAAGFPVIPTVDRVAEVEALGSDVDRFIVKPKLGSDSIGMFTDDRSGLATRTLTDVLIQPLITFDYEVSFYFIDHDFQYALHAPNVDRRWELVRYEPTDADLAFARRFVEWNNLSHGIQRIDACRVSTTGELLLVEVEDLNPFLSLDVLTADERTRFIDRMAASIEDLYRQR